MTSLHLTLDHRSRLPTFAARAEHVVPNRGKVATDELTGGRLKRLLPVLNPFRTCLREKSEVAAGRSGHEPSWTTTTTRFATWLNRFFASLQKDRLFSWISGSSRPSFLFCLLSFLKISFKTLELLSKVTGVVGGCTRGKLDSSPGSPSSRFLLSTKRPSRHHLKLRARPQTSAVKVNFPQHHYLMNDSSSDFSSR